MRTGLFKFCDKRSGIHRLSHELAAFSQENRTDEEWCRFYAATDSLLDVSSALSEFNKLYRTPTILERYGFLQALVIAQQAVEELSKSVGLDWSCHKDQRLAKVRAIRDRIAGHPVWSEKARKYNYERSSAMLDLSDSGMDGFSVVLYFENRSETIFVSFHELQVENDIALSAQLSEVEDRMRQHDREFCC